MRGIHRWPVNSPQKGQVKRKMFPFYDVIMLVKFSAPTVALQEEETPYADKEMSSF